MQVDAFMIARAAEVHDRLLYALAAGWTRCWPGPGQRYPYLTNLSVFASVRVDPAEMDGEHRFAVTARDPDEVLLGPSPIEGSFVCARDRSGGEEMSQLVHVNATLRVEFPQPGVYSLVLSLDGAEAHRIQIAALAGAP